MKSSVQLTLTGRRTKRGYEIVFFGKQIFISKRLYQLLSELVWACHTRPHGVLDNELSVMIDNDHVRGSDFIRHLREALSKDAIENCRKSYKLADAIGKPKVSMSVLELIELDYRIIRRLEEVLGLRHCPTTPSPSPSENPRVSLR